MTTTPRPRFVVRLLPWQGSGRRILPRWQVWDRVSCRAVSRWARRDRAVAAAAFLSGSHPDNISVEE